MKVLVINAGSSSLKYQLLDMTNETVIAKGGCERIGLEGAFVKHKANGKETKIEEAIKRHGGTIYIKKIRMWINHILIKIQ